MREFITIDLTGKNFRAASGQQGQQFQHFFADVLESCRMTNRRRSSRCKVCTHPDRLRIEMLRAGGAGLDALSKKFRVSRDSLHRHWHLHVPEEVRAAYLSGPGDLASFAEKAAHEGDSVLDYLRLCRGVLTTQIAAATEAGDHRTAAYVADKLRLLLETVARVTGELGNMASVTINNTTNVAVLSEHPAFLRMQAIILRALAEHPEARASVVAALRGLDKEDAPVALPSPAKTGTVIDHAA